MRLGDNIASGIVEAAGIDPAQVKRITDNVEAITADSRAIVATMRRVADLVASFLPNPGSNQS